MKIEMYEATVGEVYEGYQDRGEEGVVGYGGMLDIRPKYQREFVYNNQQEQAVIDTILNDYPLNVMYWVKNSNGAYEVLDGQQRTLSFCHFMDNEFSYLPKGSNDTKYFHSLTTEQQKKIKNYKLTIYVCEGEEQEKLEWFKRINIAGEKLTDQELRNAVYAGDWLTDAKKIFSKTNCSAANKADGLLKFKVIRQELLEKVLEWKIDADGYDSIELYMSAHQWDKDANDLWVYFQDVIDWVHKVFNVSRPKLMKNQEWGLLYNQFHTNTYNANDIESEIQSYLKDDEIQNQRGIYQYVLDRKEKHLNLRQFSDNQKIRKYEEQNGICPVCGKHFDYEQMEGDHIIPWSQGGTTKDENLQMLCKKCNREKSDK